MFNSFGTNFGFPVDDMEITRFVFPFSPSFSSLKLKLFQDKTFYGGTVNTYGMTFEVIRLR